MKHMIAVSMFLAPLLTVPGRAVNAPPPPTEGEDAARTQAPPPSGRDARNDNAEKLAKEFNVPRDQVAALRSQGLGWGEIRDTLAIARKADVPMTDVLKLRRSGMGWGQIARRYGFSLGSVVGRAREPDERSERRERHERAQRHERGGRGSDRDMDRDADRGDRGERAPRGEQEPRVEHEPHGAARAR